jgi:hypothetical protein
MPVLALLLGVMVGGGLFLSDSLPSFVGKPKIKQDDPTVEHRINLSHRSR